MNWENAGKKWNIVMVGRVWRDEGPNGELAIHFPDWRMEDPDPNHATIHALDGNQTPRAPFLDSGPTGMCATDDPERAAALWEKTTIGGYTFSELQQIAVNGEGPDA